MEMQFLFLEDTRDSWSYGASGMRTVSRSLNDLLPTAATPDPVGRVGYAE
jgi:hypothetical protein